MSNFPDWFTIDEDGLEVLIKYLIAEFENKTVKISIEVDKEMK